MSCAKRIRSGFIFALFVAFCTATQAQEANPGADLLVKSAAIISDKYLVVIPKDFLLQSGLLRMKGVLVNPELASQAGVMVWGQGQAFVNQRFDGVPQPQADPARRQQVLQKIDEVYARIRQKPEAGENDHRAWLEEVFAACETMQAGSQGNLARAALQGMLAEVSGRYEQGEKAYIRMERAAKQYGNIGLSLDTEDGQIIIRQVSPLSAASKADIRAGDVLLKVDGNEVKGNNLGEAFEKLRGAPGTKVVLTVQREGAEKAQDVTVTRTARNPWSSGVRNKFVSPESKIAYVRCWQMAEGRVSDIDDAIREMAQDGMAGLILDLRIGNYQGFDVAAELVDRLVAGEWAFVYEGRQGLQKESRAAKPGQGYPDVPLVVLMDKQTNGPQEMIAAAVRATGRGLLIGDTTAGRALGQQEFAVPGHDYRLRFASAIHRTPKGEEFQGKGIEPDIRVEMDPNERGRVINRMQMEDYGQQYYGRKRRQTEDELRDVQLDKAVEYLGGTAAETSRKEKDGEARKEKKDPDR